MDTYSVHAAKSAFQLDGGPVSRGWMARLEGNLESQHPLKLKSFFGKCFGINYPILTFSQDLHMANIPLFCLQELH